MVAMYDVSYMDAMVWGLKGIFLVIFMREGGDTAITYGGTMEKDESDLAVIEKLIG